MVNGKMPPVLALSGALLLLSVLLAVQPYSVTSPWQAYTEPARRFLGAAVRGDTAELYLQSLGATAVQWALGAARFHPDSLAYWARQAEAWAGNHHGDTAEVFVEAPSSHCNLVLHFVGPAENAKVERASSACFERR